MLTELLINDKTKNYKTNSSDSARIKTPLLTKIWHATYQISAMYFVRNYSIKVYLGWTGRNLPFFGSMFLGLIYIDITKHTCI